jgi:mannonate dehydratase
MAHIGWLRTSGTAPERGGARVTEFKMSDFKDTGASITEDELWYNYEYFIRAVIPHAEKYGIKLALHPDDPPVPRLGGVSRIMISYENIRHAVRDIVSSDSLGVTMCQANYFIMGEDLFKVIPALADKIMMIHFRNTTGNLDHFRETFHDNGELPMAKLIGLYKSCGVNVPIRVDHVPTMVGESQEIAGYDALGRLFAIGYLKGILESYQ